jgi:hypothetical protein
MILESIPHEYMLRVVTEWTGVMGTLLIWRSQTAASHNAEQPNEGIAREHVWKQGAEENLW